MLHPVDIFGVPKDTKDRDDILESEFFDTRQAFLSLCQGNHYQYDTLQLHQHLSLRAMSAVMILNLVKAGGARFVQILMCATLVSKKEWLLILTS
jgi:hypothetical protein